MNDELSNDIEILHRRYIGDDPARLVSLQQTREADRAEPVAAAKMPVVVFAFYFAWYNGTPWRNADGYNLSNIEPTFEQRHGIPYTNAYDSADVSPVDQVYAFDVQDLKSYNVDCVIAIPTEANPAADVFDWSELDEEYYANLFRRFGENRMPYLPILPRWSDLRWWRDSGLADTADYVRELSLCASRIDESIDHLLKISADHGNDYHFRDEEGKPVFWLFAASDVPVGSPDHFWRDVTIRRQTTDDVVLWGLPHRLRPNVGAVINVEDHGFSRIMWYSQMQHVPLSRWRNLRERRPLIYSSPQDHIDLFGEIRKNVTSLLDVYRPDQVIPPLANRFDKHQFTWSFAGEFPMCPPITTDHALFERLWAQCFEEIDLRAFAVSWNELAEGEAVLPQVGWDHRPWIERLRKRLALDG